MRLIGFRDYDWEQDGYFCGIPNGHLPLATIRPTIIPRAGAEPAFGASYIAERIIQGRFGHANGLADEALLDALMSRIRPLEIGDGELRAERDDGTIVAINARIQFDPTYTDEQGSINVVPVQFITTQTSWRAISTLSASKAFAGAMPDQSLALDLAGVVTVEPELRIRPTVHRASQNGAVRWRRRFQITNGTAQPFVNLPLRIPLGSTTAAVSGGKARADGGDVAVWINSQEVPRQLVGWNSAASFVWILANVPVGSAVLVEVVYGDPVRVSPALFAAATGAAFEPSLSDNALWRYSHNASNLAESHGRGLWPLEVLPASANPPSASYENAPAAWKRSITVPNSGNRDDFYQPEFSAIGGTRWNAMLDVRRRRGGTGGYASNRNADGVTISHPIGITRVAAPITYLNPRAVTKRGTSSPVGLVVLAYRGSGATPWQIAQQLSALVTVPTNATLDATFPAAQREAAIALWPFNRSEIPSTALSTAEAALYHQSGAVYTDVYLSTTGLSIAEVETETEVYEVGLELRTAGRNAAGAKVGVYRAVRIGGAATRKYAVPLNREIRIDALNKRAELYDPTTELRVEFLPARAVEFAKGNGAYANPTELGADATWFDLSPRTNPIVNAGAELNLSGWSAGFGGSVANALLSRVAAAANEGGFGFRLTFDPSGSYTVYGVSGQISRQGRDFVTVAADVRPSVAAVVPRLWIFWYDEGGAFLASSITPAYAPVGGAWTRRILTEQWRNGAAKFAIGIGATGNEAAVGRTLDYDRVRVGGNEIVVEPVGAADAGSVLVAARYRPIYA